MTNATTLLEGRTMQELRKLQDIIGQGNAERGFHAEGDNLRAIVSGTTRYEGSGETPADKALRNYFITKIALIMSEGAEAIEELRSGHSVDETWYTAKASGGGFTFEKPGEAERLLGYPGKPEGVPSEVADIVIRAFDFANEAGFDLAAIIEEKLAYNATRPFMHGRTV